MRLKPKLRETGARDNIGPMINIVFLLLVFFLLAGTLGPRPPIEIDPVTTQLSPPAEMPADGLYVAASGQLFYRQQSIDLGGLPDAARPHAEGPRSAIDVVVDRRLEARLLFQVMDALGTAGFVDVKLVTERRAAN